MNKVVLIQCTVETCVLQETNITIETKSGELNKINKMKITYKCWKVHTDFFPDSMV